MSTTPKVAESLTVIGTEYAVRGSVLRHGKWRIETTPADDRVHALTLKGHQNRALWGVGMEQNVEIVTRTIYASEWEAAS